MMDRWVWVLIVFVATGSVLWLLKRFLFARLHAFTARTEGDLDDLLVHALSLPANLLVILASAWSAHLWLTIPSRIEPHWHGLLRALLITALILFIDRFLVGLISLRKRTSANPLLLSSSSLLIVATHIVIFGLGALVILDSVGVSITPIVASLGIGSLAVALALQDTLANFFSGVYLLFDRPLEMGHFVKLESGDEGVVEKIGWRSTQIRTLANNTVVIPNSKIANSHFTNYAIPDSELSIQVQVGVGYDNDLGRVERVALETARASQRAVNGGVASFEPTIRYQTFDDSGVTFGVNLRAAIFTDQYLLRHEFIKALHTRFREEGILFALPIRKIEREATEGINNSPTLRQP
jgi:small-conductance mechanosensitive channel